MKAFVPYEKLSRKQKREMDRARRVTWGDMNPVTRKKENAKAYNRKKHRISRDACETGAFCYVNLSAEKWPRPQSIKIYSGLSGPEPSGPGGV